MKLIEDFGAKVDKYSELNAYMIFLVIEVKIIIQLFNQGLPYYDSFKLSDLFK